MESSHAKNLVELTRDVIAAMREEGYRGRTITVKVRFTDFKTYTRAKSLEKFTESERKIRKAAFDCLGRFEFKKKVRLIGVRGSNLEKVTREE